MSGENIRGAARPAAAAAAAVPSALGNGSAISQLQPSQVRTLREGFQILDRDSDGTVGREDVADMLNQLGGHVLLREGDFRQY